LPEAALPCTLPAVHTRAEIKGLLEDEIIVEEKTETLPVELDAIPGAVWQMELHALMPQEVRVTFFERGSRKCALLRCPRGQGAAAFESFVSALKVANEVSHELHLNAARVVKQAREEADAGR
jgi:hypothetical protein